MDRFAPGHATGILLYSAGIFFFALNDALGKWLVATYSVGQLMLIRSIAAIVVLTPFFWRMGWRRLIDVDRPQDLARIAARNP